MPLDSAELHTLISRSACSVGPLLDCGWLPPRACHDPALWQPRGSNVVADSLANYTMDMGETWERSLEWPFPGRELGECNVVLHSDGGSRSGCSGAAWVMEVGIVEDGEWVFKLLACGGAYVASSISSSVAEAIALEDCSLLLRKLVQRHTLHEPLGRRSGYCEHVARFRRC